MSLQRRLTLFFILIVILPLAAAGFVVQRVVVDEISNRAMLSLDPALDATVAIYNERVDGMEARVRSALLGDPELARVLRDEDPAGAARLLRDGIASVPNVDFLLALGRDGELLAFERSEGSFLPGIDLPGAQEIVRSEAGIGGGFVRTGDVPVRIQNGGPVGAVAGGMWLDESLLRAASQENVHLSLVAGDRIIASTAGISSPFGVEIDHDDAFGAEIGGHAQAKARRLGDSISLVASTPMRPIDSLANRVFSSMLGLLLVALLGTAFLAFLLARLITQPLDELAAGALAISEGRFDNRIAVRSRDEVGQLATAFNHMSDRLSDSYSELKSSRDQMQRAIRRVGETLRSTHDMAQLIESILNTTVDAIGADAGVIWRFTSTRDDLYVSSSTGLNASVLGRVRVGEGIVGLVAERTLNLLLPGTSVARPAPGEPSAPVSIAIPLFSQDRAIGVLAVYRFDEDRPFTQEDLSTVVFLGEQGGVAIENVLLHEEAQRLSLMDGLTGTWNRRFFQMQFRQVLATATRFERPFSVLMLDLDNFKLLNDTYGHQRGDAVLVEFAQRVNAALREVDTFARYGGEEFICLLSETDVSGAVITAEKICDVIRAEPFGAVGEQPVTLTVSVGVSSYPEHGDSFRQLVEAADRALYQAKEEGRDRVVVAGGPSSQLKLAT